MAESEDLERGGAFYGRRKGKRLRAGQEVLMETLLPKLRIDPGRDPRETLERSTQNLWLEIGFGGGEHLAAQARAHPDIGFIGCEPFVNGVAKLLAVIDGERLQNIRVWDRDATELISRLPPASLDRIYLLYPDPWPKRRQRKRRFVSDQTLAALARILRPGADLRFATDIDDHAGWALARVLQSPHFTWTAERPDDWRKPWPDWPGTRYETKAVRDGRAPIYLTFRRIETPPDGRRLAGGSMPALHDQLSDESIGAVIEAFYQKVRRDPALGPVFSRAITDDEWPEHLSVIRDFWSSVMLKTGRYKGNPFAAHLTVEGISPALFGRWLGLFGETCREHLAPDIAADLHGRAVAIADSLQAGLFFNPAMTGLGRRKT